MTCRNVFYDQCYVEFHLLLNELEDTTLMYIETSLFKRPVSRIYTAPQEQDIKEF